MINKNRKIIKSRWLGVYAFSIVFLFQVMLNLLIPCMRSLPDEMGAVALAANLSGYDWNFVLTHPPMYYGSGSFVFMLPFFKLIKNPLILYQCLLGVGAFLYAVPAFIACRILQKYFRITENAFLIVGMGVVSALFTPTRATNIDNEPMLVLLCWLMVYLIIVLQDDISNKKRTGISILFAVLLAVSYLSHTRALLYTVVAIIVIAIYWIITKKRLVNIWVFGITYLVSMTVVSFLVKIIKQTLFTSNAEVIVKNTPEEVTANAVNNFQSMFSFTGIRSFLDLFTSNIWVMCVYSSGIIIFVFLLFILKTKSNIKIRFIAKKTVPNRDIYFPMLFCCMGILISLLGLCIIWLPNAMAVHLEETNLSRGHFYLRYYGNYFGPLILIFFIYVWNIKDEIVNKIKLIGGIVPAIISAFAIYCVLSFLGMTTIRYQYSIDWFYYFAPFSGMVNSWPNTIQTLSYFCCATIVSFIFWLLLLKFSISGKYKCIVISLVFFFSWQYIYGVTRFDAPYAKSEDYYQSVDSTYNLYERAPEIFDDTDTLFYYNQTYGPAYIVQFMFPQYKVITDLELLENSEENIILTNELLDNEKVENGDYKYVQLDDNEYLYLNSKSKQKILKDEGYRLKMAN